MKLLSSFKDSYLRGGLIFAIDIVLSLAASLIALYSVKERVEGLFNPRFFVLYLACAMLGFVALSVLFRTFRIIIRHLGVRDVIPFAAVAVGKGVILVIALLLGGVYSKAAFLAVEIDVLITAALLLGIRVCMILVYDELIKREQNHYNHQLILVYGTSDKSVATIKRLQYSPHYKICGFIERSDRDEKYILEALPVYSFFDDKQLDRLILDRNIDAVLFTRDTDAQAEAERLLAYCSRHGVKTLIVPTLDEVSDGDNFFHPREINLEDLLGRKEIKISLEEIKAYFQDKVVMVTGAAGSIGSELVRQVAAFGVKKLVLYDNGETAMHNLRLELEDKFKGVDFAPVIGDVRHPERLDFAFRSWHPQVVFHAAAYKHVPLMEENPCEAVLVNVQGSRNVADKCLEYGVEKMVMISTDKAVNPTNIMGCTKRLAEIYVQSLGLSLERGEREGKTRFVTTRFGNVLGSNGSVIPRFREQIAKGGPVTVTHPDINRFFMTIPEACRLVMEAATMSSGNEIFVFDMGKPVKIDLLARRMITLAGFTPDKDIKIEYSGLRPGEKLYEEVLSDKENTLPAFHDRIRIAKVREYSYPEVEKAVDDMTALAKKVEIPEMVKDMMRMVPEFKSVNPQFMDL
ncbi:MAG: polysaccharide biosynthesis protein [Bacteroidales bacterium]|nr:polysaccharide biosynthesis protein [Bacteroidales bacterium]